MDLPLEKSPFMENIRTGIRERDEDCKLHASLALGLDSKCRM